jgi:hypothetical protein
MALLPRTEMTAHKYPFLLLAAFFLTAQAQAAPNMKDGMWEIATKVEIPNMPMVIPPTRHTQCLTAKNAIPQQQEKNNDCKMTSVKSDGDSISWAIQCRTKESALDGSGKVTYKGDSMDGVMTMNITDPRKGTMQMIYRMSGKYIGVCK